MGGISTWLSKAYNEKKGIRFKPPTVQCYVYEQSWTSYFLKTKKMLCLRTNVLARTKYNIKVINIYGYGLFFKFLDYGKTWRQLLVIYTLPTQQTIYTLSFI